MSETRRLQHNLDAIRVSYVRRGDAWAQTPWRCDHEDGRGRCTSLDTELVVKPPSERRHNETEIVLALCEKHRAAGGRVGGDEQP